MTNIKTIEAELDLKFPEPEHGQDWNVEVEDVKSFYRQAIKDLMSEACKKKEILETDGKYEKYSKMYFNEACEEIQDNILKMFEER